MQCVWAGVRLRCITCQAATSAPPTISAPTNTRKLSDGWLEDGCIECPLHAARFDVRTGKALCAPAETNLAVFEVRVEGGDLLVKV